MKEIKTFTGSNDKYQIPSRSEFHRYYCGLITELDFCTEVPSTHMVDKIANAVEWSEKHTRNSFVLHSQDIR